jgi:hypothetical protein
MLYLFHVQQLLQQQQLPCCSWLMRVSRTLQLLPQ